MDRISDAICDVESVKPLIDPVVPSVRDCLRPADLLTQTRRTPEQSLSNDVNDVPIDDEE